MGSRFGLRKFVGNKVQQHLTTINGTEWFTGMVTAQKDFETVYQTKTSTESAIDFPLLKDSKKKITDALVPLLTYIETNEVLTPAVYKPLAQKLNEIITEITGIAPARITRVENQKKEAAAKGK